MKRLLTVLLFALTTVASAAGVQKWVDADGKVHYGARPPSDQSAETVTTQVSVANSATRGNEAVILYSTAWCGYCKKARKYLNRNGIAFQEYDIEKNATAKRQYQRAGGRGVPLLVRGDETLQGFRRSSYDRFFSE